MMSAMSQSPVFDATDRACSICWKEFDNGDIVASLNCGGGHGICVECMNEWADAGALNDESVTVAEET